MAGGGVGDVRRHRERLAAEVADLLLDEVEPVGAAGCEDDVGAGLRGPDGQGAAQVWAHPAHQHDLSLQ